MVAEVCAAVSGEQVVVRLLFRRGDGRGQGIGLAAAVWRDGQFGQQRNRVAGRGAARDRQRAEVVVPRLAPLDQDVIPLAGREREMILTPDLPHGVAILGDHGEGEDARGLVPQRDVVEEVRPDVGDAPQLRPPSRMENFGSY